MSQAGDRHSTDRRSIGIFGGTFDPVHHGHLRVALDALEQLDLTEVRLLPLAHPVHRDAPETPVELRIAMLEAAVAGRPQLVVDRTEVDRKGPSYTVDTLRALREASSAEPFCLLLGADAFNGFFEWREPETILGLANIAILARPDAPIADAVRTLLRQRRVETLDPGRPGQIVICRVTQLAISASDIRARCAMRRSIDFLVPDRVLELIQQRGLYR